MRILATVTGPSEGSATWNGHDIVNSPDKVREIIGYLPQDFGIYPKLDCVEFLTYLAAARGIVGKSAHKRIDSLLELVNLADARRRRLGTLSGGMRQRVGIAQALLNDPKLLIVDEPTAGLDPEERIRFRNLLSELSGDRLVILSSHIVSDLEAVATSIAVMNRGKLVIHAAPEELLQSVNGKVWEIVVTSSDLAGIRKKYITGSTTRTPEGVKVRIVGENPPEHEAYQVTPTIEDAYLRLLVNHQGDPDD
jgi:ABC-type multidrug transport system ATPase subunit